MANLSEDPVWVDGIYQLETTDVVLGGPDGIDNVQAKALANRTAYLKQEVDARAPIASPTFTGAPEAPTPAAGNDSTRLATTEFVTQALASILNAPPSTLDTLNELAAALGDDPNFSTTMMTLLSQKAPLASPAFTGTPEAPTANPGTNTTQLATTAFVVAAVLAQSKQSIGSYSFALANPSPSHFLELNGATYNRSTYADLFNFADTNGLLTTEAAWSTAKGLFSDGDGVSTFRLPDYRGAFLRVLDGGANLDPGRSLGSYQEDEFKEHSHLQYFRPAQLTGGTDYFSRGNDPVSHVTTQTNGVQASGGAETRPKNYATRAFIRYA